ncbi:MAG: hypothetical protein DYG98_15345 [Haliscomenobacteraceae bacterium CHB4]|nr:hypothetical protein [Haliscomenobacteraceae bacterium CHB4]
MVIGYQLLVIGIPGGFVLWIAGFYTRKIRFLQIMLGKLSRKIYNLFIFKTFSGKTDCFGMLQTVGIFIYLKVLSSVTRQIIL